MFLRQVATDYDRRLTVQASAEIATVGTAVGGVVDLVFTGHRQRISMGFGLTCRPFRSEGLPPRSSLGEERMICIDHG